MAKENSDIGSLVVCLHLTPKQTRMIAERDKLSGRRLDGQCDFSQTESDRSFEERIGVGDANDAIHVGLPTRMSRLLKNSRMLEDCRKSDPPTDVLTTVKKPAVLLGEEKGRVV